MKTAMLHRSVHDEADELHREIVSSLIDVVMIPSKSTQPIEEKYSSMGRGLWSWCTACLLIELPSKRDVSLKSHRDHLSFQL